MPSYWERMQEQRQRRLDSKHVKALAVKRLRDQGYSYREIASALGISHETVRRILWDLSH